jgi:60S ribosome subunit biogenesis protein NIP7
MTHRTPTREEKTAINRALDRWGVFDALSGSAFLVKEEGKSRVACLASRQASVLAISLHPCSAGLAIGELGKQFTPTLAGADLFARSGGAGKYYVSVSENAEQLVLYGRDVMGESIARAAGDLGENELVIITNRNGEAIGIGRTRFAGRGIFQKGRITITTLADAGRYLRDEGGERQAKMARSPRR